jgi:hypothetical protein
VQVTSTHVNVNWTDKQKGHEEAARIGTHCAAGVLRAYERLTTSLSSAR